MGIRGIDILKGGIMENARQQHESAAPAPVEPPTPAHEEANAAAPEPDNQVSETDEDVAPDADEPGDEEVPEELQEHVHEGNVVPDEVDQEG
jgi:hypothetical protein